MPVAMKRIILSLIILSSLALHANAEPTQTVSYLMNTPVTLFDWGLFRLGESLKTTSNKSSIVEYDWDTNRIKISMKISPSKKGGKKQKAFTEDEAREVCLGNTRMIKALLGVNPDTGKPYRDAHSFLDRIFNHLSHQDKSRPKNVGKELDKMTHISGSAYFKKNNKRYIITCKSTLLGTNIFFSEPILQTEPYLE